MGESGEKKHMTARRCAHARTHARTLARTNERIHTTITIHRAYRIPHTMYRNRMPHAACQTSTNASRQR